MQNIGLYNTIQHNTYNNLTIYLNLSNYVWNYTISITDARAKMGGYGSGCNRRAGKEG